VNYGLLGRSFITARKIWIAAETNRSAVTRNATFLMESYATLFSNAGRNTSQM